MTRRPRVLVIGDVMRDIVVMSAGEMRRGSDVNASIRIVPGGQGANQARWLAHQQVAVTLVARVGAGDHQSISAELSLYGVDALLADDPELPTGTLINLSEPGRERSFFTDRGANKNLAIEDVRAADLPRADLVLLSAYVMFSETGRRTAKQTIAWAQKAGVRIAVDAASAGYISDLGVSQFLSLTAGVDLLLANAQEAQLLSGAENPVEQVERLLGNYPQVVIKQGAKGAIASAPDGGIISCAAEPTACVDSTGAGDAFAAGFLSARLNGKLLADGLAAGNRAAALAISRVGGGPQPS